MPILEAHGITKRFGGLLANDHIDFAVAEGEIVGLIGPNGAGKTTFFNVLTGFYRPDSGTVRFLGRDVTGLPPEALCRLGLARTFQVVRTFGNMTVLENVMVGAFVRTASPRKARAKALQILRLGGLYARRDLPAIALTIAEKKRLEMLRALATEPRLLLLDEAMAGLTPTEVQEAVALVQRLREQGLTIVLVEHVMEVVMPLSDRVVVLATGRKIAEGPPQQVAQDPRVIRAYLGERYAQRKGLVGSLSGRAGPAPS